MSTPFPVLEKIGHIPPDSALLSSLLRPGFVLGGFTNGARPPSELLNLLKMKSLQTSDHEDMGMLFASLNGVELHEDELPTVLWVLSGTSTYSNSHQLIVGSEHTTLKVGDVYLFDARIKHGVIAAEPGLWSIFSTYVAPLDTQP